MPQPPNSQPPSPKPGANTEITTKQPTEVAQKTSNQAETFWKTQSIKAVRGTIRVLEGVLVKLEAPSVTKETSSLNQIGMWWSGALAKIRSLLPENLSSNLSDAGLSIILAVIAAIAIWATSNLLSGEPTEVATPAERPIPIAQIETPPELTAPAVPEPVEVVPEPVPKVELTPEQKLVASIQNQVAEITDRYANGLIQSIKADFQGSSLVIKVSDDWYSFAQSQQDKLVDRMLERARELDFSHLEITDAQGKTLARSPVVGNNMIILRRQLISNDLETKG